MTARAEFDEVWKQIEGARMRRAPEPQDKLQPLFRKGSEGYQTFYIKPPRGWVWCCWQVSEYVNAAGYVLMWRRGRRKNCNYEHRDSYMAAKTRAPLMRMARKYQAARPA